MNSNAPISTIMTRELVTLNLNDSLYEAERLFKKNRIRHIPVVDNEQIVGILSYTDLMRISFGDAVVLGEIARENVVYDTFTIAQIMKSAVDSVSSNTTIKEVAIVLAAKEYHALPVIDDGELKGIVTTTDLLNYLTEHID